MAKAGKQRRMKDEPQVWLPGGFSYVPPGGRLVTPIQAENLAALSACVQIISGAIATLPATVYRTASDGTRTEQPQHPASRLIRAPNAHMTWPDLAEWAMASALLHGNALIGIDYDGAGRPTQLTPIPWPFVVPLLLPSNKLVFDQMPFPFGATMLPPRRWLQGDVVHLKDRSDDGYLGRPRIQRAAEAVGNSLSLQEYNSGFWMDGAAPAGILTSEKSLNDDARKRLRAEFNEWRGGKKREFMLVAGRADILAAQCDPRGRAGSRLAVILRHRDRAALSGPACAAVRSRGGARERRSYSRSDMVRHVLPVALVPEDRGGGRAHFAR
jgi:phage portal protein BeeE